MNVRVVFHHKVHKDHKGNSHCHIEFLVSLVFFVVSLGRWLDRFRLVFCNKALLGPTCSLQYLSNCCVKVLKLPSVLRKNVDNHLTP